MSKSPGFWFFTGDWMKDPELRFCSIFARGLLVDLLCILFEAKERGYASNPDGTPRTDAQIVDAITGGSREEKLAALSELEKSGVLSRDSRGVLYSRRLARLAEVSETRSKAGSKGGSKTQAKPNQNDKQTDKQNTGVSVSVSDSDTFCREREESEASLEKPLYRMSKEFQDAWNHLRRHLTETGKPMTGPTEEQNLYNLRRAFPEEERQIACINYTIKNGWKTLVLTGDFEKPLPLIDRQPSKRPTKGSTLLRDLGLKK